MPRLTYVARTILPDAGDMSHITDLAIFRVGGQDRLVATTRTDGVLASWDIDGADPVLLDTLGHLGGLRAGATGQLSLIDVGGTPTVLASGAADGGLRLLDIAGDGTISAAGDVADTAGLIGGLGRGVVVTLTNGQQVVYGGVAGADGLGRIRFDTTGAVQEARITQDTAATYAAAISDVAHLTVGGQRYVYTASATEHGITTWVVGGTGGVAAGPGLGMDEGLWITAPSALATATIEGTSFLVVAAAGSSSLSVIRVDLDGSLHVTDHMLDTRETRFGGVTALDVVTVNGHTYVVSGGADDGINLHQLLPGGQLVHIDALADTPAMNLANVSAITAQARGAELQIFVASASEVGVTKLVFDTGPAGQVLTAAAGGGTVSGGAGRDVITGQGGDDRLSGGAGDDILRDGAGSDTLTGGAGADVFILSYDDAPDVITDFTLGEDRLDLSGWPMVRSKSQLTLEITATGFRVTYGAEVLEVHASDGNLIDHRLLTDADLIGGARIPQVILPGFPGPWTPPPAVPRVDPAPGTGTGGDTGRTEFTLPGVTIGQQYYPHPTLGAVNGRIFSGTSRSDSYAGSFGNDEIRGQGGDDRLAGSKGTDRLYGGTGTDRLAGASGDDMLDGGAGDDLVYGGTGADLLYGGAGNDKLIGETGSDLIYGGDGNNRLWGGSDHDRLYGGAGSSVLFGQTGNDQLTGGTGADLLFGGDGSDHLTMGGGHDSAWGLEGNDKLTGQDGNDQAYGGNGHDYINGGRGDDRLTGGTGNDDIYGDTGHDTVRADGGDDRVDGGDGNDLVYGGSGRDVIRGGWGQDTLLGGNDDDVIYGNGHADRIAGGRGHDLLGGNDGSDVVFGEDGNDDISGDTGDDLLFGGTGHDTIRGGSGHDRLEGGTGGDTLWGQTGDDTIVGQDGRDLLYGDDGSDRLIGGNDHDVLFGGAGHDRLEGGAGQDRLTGATGDDVLFGGGDADTFVFTAGHDLVTDFQRGLDTLAIEGDLYAGTLQPAEILILYGQIVAGSFEIDFGGGNIITLLGVTDAAGLADSITIF